MDETVLGAVVAGIVAPAAVLAVLLFFPPTNVTAILGAIALSKAVAMGSTAVAAARAGGDMDRALEWTMSHVGAVRWASAIATGLWIAFIARSPLLAAALYFPSTVALMHIELFVFRIRRPVPESAWIWLQNFVMVLGVVLAVTLVRRLP
jgi:hypothetical protein